MSFSVNTSRDTEVANKSSSDPSEPEELVICIRSSRSASDAKDMADELQRKSCSVANPDKTALFTFCGLSTKGHGQEEGWPVAQKSD